MQNGKTIFSTVLLIFMLIISLSFNNNKELQGQSFIPKEGFVPDDSTAIKIAEAIWLPIYGNSALEMKPYKVELKDTAIWVVEGALPKGFKGGAPYIEIQKSDCKILKVSHGK